PPEGEVFHIGGTFRAVEAPSHLAFTFAYEEPDPDDQETLVTVTFEPTEQGTVVVVEQSPFKTAERCALHRDGWTDSLERLEQALAYPPLDWASVGSIEPEANSRRVRRRPVPPP